MALKPSIMLNKSMTVGYLLRLLAIEAEESGCQCVELLINVIDVHGDALTNRHEVLRRGTVVYGSVLHEPMCPYLSRN